MNKYTNAKQHPIRGLLLGGWCGLGAMFIGAAICLIPVIGWVFGPIIFLSGFVAPFYFASEYHGTCPRCGNKIAFHKTSECKYCGARVWRMGRRFAAVAVLLICCFPSWAGAGTLSGSPERGEEGNPINWTVEQFLGNGDAIVRWREYYMGMAPRMQLDGSVRFGMEVGGSTDGLLILRGFDWGDMEPGDDVPEVWKVKCTGTAALSSGRTVPLVEPFEEHLPGEANTSGEAPEWTDVTGEYHVRAWLVGYNRYRVTLRKADGKEVVVPLRKLDESSRKQAKEIYDRELSPRMREWRVAGLDDPVTAKLIQYRMGRAILQTEAGRTVKVPMRFLAENDVQYVLEWSR